MRNYGKNAYDEVADIRESMSENLRRLRRIADNDNYVLRYIIRPLEDIIDGPTIDGWLHHLSDSVTDYDSEKDRGNENA